MAAGSKTSAINNAWTLIAAGGVYNATPPTVTTALNAALQISVASVEAVANALGALVTVDFGYADAESWREKYRFRMAAGTANLEPVTVQAAADQAVITVASTADLDTVGQWFVVHNTVDVTKSEMRQLQTFTTNTNITVINDLVNIQQTSAVITDLVETKYIPIPPEVKSVAVNIWNDDDNCDIIFQVGSTLLDSIA